jgi:hypothetical protein
MFTLLYAKEFKDVPIHPYSKGSPESGEHRRSFGCAGMNLVVTADEPFSRNTFRSKINDFQPYGNGAESIYIHHHFSLPDLKRVQWGELIQKTEPWEVHRKGQGWIYKGIIANHNGTGDVFKLAVFNNDHSRALIFSPDATHFEAGDLASLCTFPTDQLMLLRTLSTRNACIFHSGGMILDGQGLLFIGHSGAGKSTMVTLMKHHGDILCDDRNIIRKENGNFQLYGTWSHGDVPLVSSKSAPLKAMLIIEKSPFNRLTRLTPSQSVRILPKFVVRSFRDREWWGRVLALVDKAIENIPVFRLQFNRDGEVVQILKKLAATPVAVHSTGGGAGV